LSQHRTGLAFVFIAIFHGLFGLTLWSLLTTVSRGPGAVGEQLLHPSARDAEAGSSGDLSNGQRDEEQEQEPLITSAKQARPPGRRRKTTVSSNEDDDLELRGSGSSSEGEHQQDESEDEYDEAETGERRPVIIWPSRDQGADTVMAKANGKPRFCRKVGWPRPISPCNHLTFQ